MSDSTGIQIPAEMLRAQRNQALADAADMQAYATILQGRLAEAEKNAEPAVT